MSSHDITATANGIPVTAPVAYLVVTGQYDDRTVLCACADERDAAHVEPVEYDPGPAARVIPPESAPARPASSEREAGQ
jgi:hypothetical protein